MPTRSVKPVQARAQATRELLITSAAELLGEVGVERLSTNLICARAGVTAPAFYRYFRDKYAILEELGERLMAAQNAAVEALLARDRPGISERDVAELILESIAITKRFPGGPWVLHALRAVPALQHVRLASHRRMSARIADAAAEQTGRPRREALLGARLLIDMGYAAIELAFDEPGMGRRALAQTAARSLAPLAAAIRGG